MIRNTTQLEASKGSIDLVEDWLERYAAYVSSPDAKQTLDSLFDDRQYHAFLRQILDETEERDLYSALSKLTPERTLGELIEAVDSWSANR